MDRRPAPITQHRTQDLVRAQRIIKALEAWVDGRRLQWLDHKGRWIDCKPTDFENAIWRFPTFRAKE